MRQKSFVDGARTRVSSRLISLKCFMCFISLTTLNLEDVWKNFAAFSLFCFVLNGSLCVVVHLELNFHHEIGAMTHRSVFFIPLRLKFQFMVCAIDVALGSSENYTKFTR